jgi:hypothetical protein
MAIGDGKYIAIRFSQPLTGDVSGLTPTPVGGYTDAPLTIQSVAASSEYSTSYKATNLTDGSTSTYWRPAAADLATATVLFMLPAPSTLKKLRLYNGSSTYYIKNFTLYGSADALDWTAIYSGTGTSTVGWQEHEISATPGTPYKYYKLAVMSYNSSYYYIYELEVKTHKPIGNERAFTVVGQRYDMMPEGSLIPYAGAVESVGQYDSVSKALDLSEAALTQTVYTGGAITLAYDTTGGET